jgi:hypothetical protein
MGAEVGWANGAVGLTGSKSARERFLWHWLPPKLSGFFTLQALAVRMTPESEQRQAPNAGASRIGFVSIEMT